MSMRGLRWSGIGMGNDVIKNRSLAYCYTRERNNGNKYVSLWQKRVKGKDYGNPSEKRRLATD